MDEEHFSKLPDLSKVTHYNRFPDGRIDYTDREFAIVLSCAVSCQGKILLLKRSEEVGSAKGQWYVLAGYVDEDKPVVAKAIEELQEETGISKDMIASITTCEKEIISDKGVELCVYSVNLELKEFPEITLDWEHTEYKWIYPEEVSNFDHLPNLPLFLRKLGLIK